MRSHIFVKTILQFWSKIAKLSYTNVTERISIDKSCSTKWKYFPDFIRVAVWLSSHAITTLEWKIKSWFFPLNYINFLLQLQMNRVLFYVNYFIIISPCELWNLLIGAINFAISSVNLSFLDLKKFVAWKFLPMWYCFKECWCFHKSHYFLVTMKFLNLRNPSKCGVIFLILFVIFSLPQR